MTTHDTATNNRTHTDGRPARFRATETKAAIKTTELIVFVVAVLGVLIASAMVDKGDDGQAFGAERAWLYVTILAVGYMVSRGLAKSGSREPRDDDNN
jgi:hypothetical protein